MSTPVTLSIENHIAHVCLNRPEKWNAINEDMFKALAEVGEEICNNNTVRAVVLSGEGESFCAGIDLEIMQDSEWMSDPFGSGRGDNKPNFFQKPAYIWQQCNVPVICAIQGVAFGGGLQIALGADIRIIHPKAKLSVMEVKWGIIPDMSLSVTLPKLVRTDVAKELVFTGREAEAEEAHQLGLVTRVSDEPLAAALDLANEIASKSPDAIRAAKHLLNQCEHLSDIEALALEQELQTQIIGKLNNLAAVRAGLRNKEPQFIDSQFQPQSRPARSSQASRLN